MSIDCAFFGSLTRDAERRTSKAGKPYALLNVRVGDGDSVQYVSALVFGDAVENVGTLPKGARVYCEGSAQIDTWQGSDGTTRAGFKVMSFKAVETHHLGRNKQKRNNDSERPRAGSSRQRELELTAPRPADGPRDFDDEIPF
jgi:single-stranded DNA-binding protein